MDLVGGVGIPNYKLSVLRGANKVSSIGSPVHGIYFSQMSFESTSNFHGDSRQLFKVSSDNFDYRYVMEKGTYEWYPPMHLSSA